MRKTHKLAGALLALKLSCSCPDFKSSEFITFFLHKGKAIVLAQLSTNVPSRLKSFLWGSIHSALPLLGRETGTPSSPTVRRFSVQQLVVIYEWQRGTPVSPPDEYGATHLSVGWIEAWQGSITALGLR